MKADVWEQVAREKGWLHMSSDTILKEIDPSGNKVAQQFVRHHHRNPHSRCGTLHIGIQILDGYLHKVQSLMLAKRQGGGK